MPDALVGATLYLKNPDVVLREEDADGGLLFNPDTNQVKVVNATGLFLWKRCEQKCRLDDLVRAVQDSFAGVPAGVADDVTSFVQNMVASGFIGTVVC